MIKIWGFSVWGEEGYMDKELRNLMQDSQLVSGTLGLLHLLRSFFLTSILHVSLHRDICEYRIRSHSHVEPTYPDVCGR